MTEEEKDALREMIREELSKAALVPKPICRLCGQQIGSAGEALGKCGSTVCPMKSVPIYGGL